MNQTIKSSILLIGLLGVSFFAFNFLNDSINTQSEIFKLISYISLGVVVAIIARIIIFPKGMLSEIPSVLKYTSVLTLIVSYYLLKKNVILSTLLACIFFYICLKLFDY